MGREAFIIENNRKITKIMIIREERDFYIVSSDRAGSGVGNVGCVVCIRSRHGIRAPCCGFEIIRGI
ncbi:MAG TPA: hypothetical protein IAA06_13705, partial [Candidatus Blautia faecavium]|nr:hypothetical protein [Candidatus Blautia faecavium]